MWKKQQGHDKKTIVAMLTTWLVCSRPASTNNSSLKTGQGDGACSCVACRCASPVVSGLKQHVKNQRQKDQKRSAKKSETDHAISTDIPSTNAAGRRTDIAYRMWKFFPPFFINKIKKPHPSPVAARACNEVLSFTTFAASS